MKWFCLLLFAVLAMAMTVPPPEMTTPKILAHYMPWFRAEKTDAGMIWEHWEWYGRGTKHDPETVLENGRHDISSVFYPAIGPYDGRDPAVLEYHLLTAKAVGIDGFVADWYGPGTYTDQVFADLVKAAERYGMKAAICLEEKSFFQDYAKVATRAEAMNEMERHIRHVLTTHARSPAYLTHQGRPVLFIFNGYGDGPLGKAYLSPDEVRDVLARFESEKPFLVRGWCDPAYNAAIGGCYCWATAAGDREKFYTNAVAARLNGQLGYVVGVASPGFDDSGVYGWGSGVRITDRRGTKEYEENWEEVLRYRPDAVQIATWNDFQEGTTIEPAEEYGHRFVDVTEQYAARYSGRPARLSDNKWPLRLYRLRRQAAKLKDTGARAEWMQKLDRFANDFSGGRRFLMGWRLGALERGLQYTLDEQK